MGGAIMLMVCKTLLHHLNQFPEEVSSMETVQVLLSLSLIIAGGGWL